MANPKVTFIVPCYNLAHLLAECVDSILTMTYTDFELLIMDDCSPDNTPAVAASFVDARIRYVRNETNLGNLANFNKGIALARGEYVWLISADDRLRSPHVLERYVSLMEAHPEVGYVFCPAVKLENGEEAELLAYSYLGARDEIFPGKAFLEKLLESNHVSAPAAMARKECYEKVSMFPLDLPHAGDWYMWCIFAFYYDVAYLAEPMVNYRHHGKSLTNILKNQNDDILFRDNITVLKRLQNLARQGGHETIVAGCTAAMRKKYGERLMSTAESTGKNDLNAFEGLLNHYSPLRKEQRPFIAPVYARQADHRYWSGNTAEARRLYQRALRNDWRLPEVWLKYLLLASGKIGSQLRTGMSRARRHVCQT